LTESVVEGEEPDAVGVDRLINVLAARAMAPAPLIIVDCGTATTFEAVSAAGALLGGAIAPGLGIAAEALFSHAALLPRIELSAPLIEIKESHRRDGRLLTLSVKPRYNAATHRMELGFLFADKIVYIRQPNKSAAGARNTAIRQARGELLAFLDTDDQWLPEHLSAQMKLFEDDPTLNLVYANGLSVGNAQLEHEFMDWCPTEGPADFQALVLERCHIPVCTVVARKTAIERAGLFDESLTRCDDYDMWLRAAFHGAKIAYTHKVQARMSQGRPGSLGASRVKMTEAYWVILDKALRTLPLTESDRVVVQDQATKVRALYLLDEGKYYSLHSALPQGDDGQPG